VHYVFTSNALNVWIAREKCVFKIRLKVVAADRAERWRSSGQRQRMPDSRTCWAYVAGPPASDERLNAGAIMQKLGILVYSSPTGTLEPSQGDIYVSVDKVCNW